MTPREIDIASAKLSVEIARVMRGQPGAVIMAALTTGLGIFVAHSTKSESDSDKLIDGVAEKLKTIVKKVRTPPRATSN